MASAEEQELHDKIDALCVTRFGDSSPAHMKQLFLSYDGNGDDALSRDEMKKLLSDADIGNFITRGAWVDGIFEKLDKSPSDDRVTWEEYLAASSSPKPPGQSGPPTTVPGTPPPVTPGLSGSYEGSGQPSGDWQGQSPSAQASGFGAAPLLAGAVVIGLGAFVYSRIVK